MKYGRSGKIFLCLKTNEPPKAVTVGLIYALQASRTACTGLYIE